jgi:hypothetical protein
MMPAVPTMMSTVSTIIATVPTIVATMPTIVATMPTIVAAVSSIITAMPTVSPVFNPLVVGFTSSFVLGLLDDDEVFRGYRNKRIGRRNDRQEEQWQGAQSQFF